MPAPKGHPPYPGCEKGGRPLEWTEERAEKLRLELEEWMKDPKNFWFMDFVLERDIPTDILWKLSKKYEKFRETYKKAVKIQEQRVAKGGLFNITNSTFSMFVLKCNHGWTEGKDTSGIEEEHETPSTRALEAIKKIAVQHSNDKTDH